MGVMVKSPERVMTEEERAAERHAQVRQALASLGRAVNEQDDRSFDERLRAAVASAERFQRRMAD